jgi:hypothetical protein
MVRAAMTTALLILAAGCGNSKQTETASNTQSAQGKPIVALVPMIDCSNHDLTWNVSLELTKNVRDRMVQHDAVYLMNEEKVQGYVKKLNEANDPFSADISWVKRAFPQTEFIVFSELVEHKEHPVHGESGKAEADSAAQLQMIVRLRVLDLRGAEPKVVLQEFVKNAHFLPWQFTKDNFYQVAWGNEMYEISPLGMAHSQLTSEISSRVESYILLNRG